MEIVKISNIDSNKGEHGNFVLKPEEGWKISYTFIDYESRLLVVSVSLIDESKWGKPSYGSRTIPTKEYKIDRTKAIVLSRDQWSAYFDYTRKETFSADGKFKLVAQRVYDGERELDLVKEELFDCVAGLSIATGTSVAFQDKKRSTLLEQHYDRILETEMQALDSEIKLDLMQHYRQELQSLKDMDDILCFYSAVATFQLSYICGKFHLFKGPILPKTSRERESMKFISQSQFNTLDDFWKSFSSEPQWYVQYNILHLKANLSLQVLGKFFIEAFNEIRRKQEFNTKEYAHIQKWETVFETQQLKPSVWKQYCSNCFSEVPFNPRYPRAICSVCYAKDKRDATNRLVEFSNIGVSGGLRVVYLDENRKVIGEDDTQFSCDCMIDGKLFSAEEGRFGGIVVQRSTQEDDPNS